MESRSLPLSKTGYNQHPEGGKGREGAEGGERIGKGEGWLDICPGAPEFLVTPLPAPSSRGVSLHTTLQRRHCSLQRYPDDPYDAL